MQVISFGFMAALGIGSLLAMQDQVDRVEQQKQDQEQGPGQDEEPSLEPVADPTQKWIDLLGDPRFRVREEAFEELKKLGHEAAEELEAAADHEDPEVRWRVQRLQEELAESTPEGPRLRRLSPDEKPEDMLRDWRDRRRSLFRGPLLGPPSEEMKGLMRRIEEMQNESLRLLRERPGFGPEALGPGASWSFHRNDNGQVSSVRIHVGPDGRVEAEERRGDEITRVEADSIDELKKLHPEWFEDLDVNVAPLTRRPWRVTPVPEPDARPEDRGPSGPQLGVRVESVHPAVSEYLGLGADEGLMVREVVAGSRAQGLGVQPHDLLLEVNGRPIRGHGDVAMALTTAGDDVAVVVLRKGIRKVLRQL